MLKKKVRMSIDEPLLKKVGIAIQIIQANDLDLVYNLKTGEYEVTPKDDNGCVLESFNCYQKLIDYAEKLPNRRLNVNDAEINLN